jgi:hypothetical protein
MIVGGLCPNTSQREAGPATQGTTFADLVTVSVPRANRRRSAEASAPVRSHPGNAKVLA